MQKMINGLYNFERLSRSFFLSPVTNCKLSRNLSEQGNFFFGCFSNFCQAKNKFQIKILPDYILVSSGTKKAFWSLLI